MKKLCEIYRTEENGDICSLTGKYPEYYYLNAIVCQPKMAEIVEEILQLRAEVERLNKMLDTCPGCQIGMTDKEILADQRDQAIAAIAEEATQRGRVEAKLDQALGDLAMVKQWWKHWANGYRTRCECKTSKNERCFGCMVKDEILNPKGGE